VRLLGRVAPTAVVMATLAWEGLAKACMGGGVSLTGERITRSLARVGVCYGDSGMACLALGGVVWSGVLCRAGRLWGLVWRGRLGVKWHGNVMAVSWHGLVGPGRREQGAGGLRGGLLCGASGPPAGADRREQFRCLREQARGGLREQERAGPLKAGAGLINLLGGERIRGCVPTVPRECASTPWPSMSRNRSSNPFRLPNPL
jgi:hypothetical protein